MCIRILVRVVGGDGNLLFNVGPMPDGLIEPRQARRLQEMGQWLNRYGESIYKTRGGPFKQGSWGASTHRGNHVYLHILNWHKGMVALPPLPQKIVDSKNLTGGRVTVTQTDKSIVIFVPKPDRQSIDTIVVLELDEPVITG
jgi:alpha-L-fucosidase